MNTYYVHGLPAYAQELKTGISTGNTNAFHFPKHNHYSSRQ